MAYRHMQAQKKLGGVWARKRRLAFLPRPERSWLLAGTALATGFLAFGVGPASANCIAIDGGG